MKKFKEIKSIAIPVETENIDTDQIIPARFLKTTEKTGLGKYMFANWRYDESGKAKKSIFDDPKYSGAQILIAGTNFGIGSSREHAVWAILDYGINAVISSEFGDIFYNNALKNGLLCIRINEEIIKKIFTEINKNQEQILIINLEEQIIKTGDGNINIRFEIDSFRKTCLILGVDELGYILSHENKIKEYEKRI